MIPNFDGLFRSPPAFGTSVTLSKVTKSFGAKPILRGLDLHIPRGQFVAVVGRSGCGKSTLLRLIAGLDQAETGHISYGDKASVPAHGIARVMFQESRLLPWARVLSNVEVGLGADYKTPDARARALAALQSMGLEERAHDWPAALSGGQKQRVALARALVSRPRLLAFDEPLGALDALTRIEMQNVLESVWLADRFTAVLVTHDVQEAVALADRIVILEEGVIARDIPVPLPRPRQRGAADFAALVAKILDHFLGRGRAVPPSNGTEHSSDDELVGKVLAGHSSAGFSHPDRSARSLSLA
jgi:sulfonate transport system ATP-binding protein